MVSAKPRSRRCGYALIEMMIAITISLVVVLALGKIILVNQASWRWGQDKIVLQQNTSEALEWLARSIHAANALVVVGADEFRTFDEAGALAHVFQLATAGGVPRLQEDGQDLTDRRCTQFVVVANADTTSLTLTLQLEDNAGNRVAGMTRATVRNRTFVF